MLRIVKSELIFFYEHFTLWVNILRQEIYCVFRAQIIKIYRRSAQISLSIFLVYNINVYSNHFAIYLQWWNISDDVSKLTKRMQSPRIIMSFTHRLFSISFKFVNCKTETFKTQLRANT